VNWPVCFASRKGDEIPWHFELKEACKVAWVNIVCGFYGHCKLRAPTAVGQLGVINLKLDMYGEPNFQLSALFSSFCMMTGIYDVDQALGTDVQLYNVDTLQA